MATDRVVLGIICLIAVNSSGLFGGGALMKFGAENPKQNTVLSIAQHELGVREQTGKNDGKRVEEYLCYVGLPKGNPWCAAFVSWVYGQAGYKQPRTAWSPALFPKEKISLNPKSADVFGIYFPSLKRIAHCGLVEKTQKKWIITIEGNTNLAGSNEGGGVYRKWRHRKTIAVFAHWLPEKGADHE